MSTGDTIPFVYSVQESKRIESAFADGLRRSRRLAAVASSFDEIIVSVSLVYDFGGKVQS
jgi:hypothetical protein